jgi:hypothetical protein
VDRVAEADGLAAFGSELAPESPLVSPVEEPDRESDRPRGVGRFVAWSLVFGLVAGLSGAGAWNYQRRADEAVPGALTIQSNPPGLDVVIGGTLAGRTPLTVSLPRGSHRVQVGTAGQRRDFDVAMPSGGTVQHHLDMAAGAPPVEPVVVGSLLVQTDLPSMAVAVDGVERGFSPLTIDDLPAGEHEVVVRGQRRVIRRTVSIKAGETVSLVVAPIGPTVAAPGWLSVSAPVVMQIREGGQLIGTTETEKLMLASGDHVIELANEPLGYQAFRAVTVAPEKITSIAVELPPGLLSINAQPWAEVWIDGERVGETPIGNLAMTLGSHEVVLRHPQLGERRERVLVTLHKTARLGVDLRSPRP